MNTLFLWTKRKGWTKFEYDSLDDIRNEFESRNIIVGKNVQIGNNVHIATNVCICHNACIGDNVYLGEGTTIDSDIVIMCKGSNCTIIGNIGKMN